jgi:hypothetical protein
MKLGRKLEQELKKESARFFKNCGQIVVGDHSYDSSLYFTAAINVSDTITNWAARKILEDMASLNVVMETLKQGNQYDPDNLKGKCPKLFITPDGEGGVNTGTEWW